MGGMIDGLFGSEAGSQSEWDNFDTADFEDISNEGIKGYSGSNGFSDFISSKGGKMLGGAIGGALTSGGGRGGFQSLAEGMPAMYIGDTNAASTPDSTRFIKNRYKDMSDDGNVGNLISILKGMNQPQQQRKLQLPQNSLLTYMNQLGGY